ncbi:Protein tyrosine phosphatase type IVA 1 [Boothiomyces sp. JEL0838]|nr:Protein tyrosine phosphatase type IVA 1 [Boothiomyces sp. JEL0838]
MDEGNPKDITDQNLNSNLPEINKSQTLKKKLDPIGGAVEQLKKKGVNFSPLEETGEGASTEFPPGSSRNDWVPADQHIMDIGENIPLGKTQNMSKEESTGTNPHIGNEPNSLNKPTSSNPIPKNRKMSYQDFSSPAKTPNTRMIRGSSFSQRQSNFVDVAPVARLSIGTEPSQDQVKHDPPSRSPPPISPLDRKHSIRSGRGGNSQELAQRSISKSKKTPPAMGFDPNRRISIADNPAALRTYISKEVVQEAVDEHAGQLKGIVKSASIDDGDQMQPLLGAGYAITHLHKVELAVMEARHSGLVILEFWMHLTYELTIFAMNDAASALIGYFITRKRGFSLAACGFVHTGHLQKLSFASKLGYRSPSRKFLSRISLFWLLQLVAALLPIFAAASLSYQDFRYLSGTLTCEIFDEEGYLYDRGYPKVQTAMGVGELIFGNSFGILRSEQEVNVTTFIISPQLIDAASLTTVIQGDGFVTTLSTSCICAANIDIETLESIGYDSATATAMYAAAPPQDFTKTGFISNVATPQNGGFNVTTILTGSTACAMTAENVRLYPICTTQIYDHKKATISMEFATDGSPASIAAVNAHILNVGDTANITWIYQSLVNILEGETSFYLLPQTYNGAVNPLMWWTTTNMIAVDPAILEPGIETMIGILLRSGVFRSFSSKGYSCPQSVVNPDYLIIYISDFGYGMGVAFVIIELFILIMCIIAFIPWLRATKPLGPGIRIAHDRTYFTVMVNSAAVQAFGITPMLETDVMWNKFDFIVRVGESKKTKDDPEFGQILVDVPKFVSAFQNGKLISEPTYDAELLENEGISVVESYFEDGNVPSNEIIEKYFKYMDEWKKSDQVIAIHCVSGIGRAPLLVCCALIDAGMDRIEAVEYVRQRRRGAINKTQLNWLLDKKNGFKRKKGSFLKKLFKK